MIINYNIDEVNKELWDICEDFRIQTSTNNYYLDYISALLYVIYYKDDELDSLKKLYATRKSFYIGENIDLLVEYVKRENENLFYDIKFSEIKIYRNIGEENILSKVIERLYNLIMNIQIKFGESKKYMSEAYKYILIQIFANGNISLRNGEVYTPTGIAKTMIGCLNIEKSNVHIYDPYCGTGNILINIPSENIVYGEEESQVAYNICMTSLILNNNKNKYIKFNDYEERNDLQKKYDYIVSNPPFIERSLRNKMIHNQKILYNYGSEFLAAGDYAYVISMFEKLVDSGKMAVILPHGALFRETEKEVRKYLINNNKIEAIIGLPENMFFGTRISVIIMILAKNKTNDDIVFIDASKEFKSKRKINILEKSNQEKIINTYLERKEIVEYSHVAKVSEIIQNDFNLTIKKYIRKKEKKKKIEKNKIIENIDNLEKEIDILEENIKDVLEKLEMNDILKTYKNNNSISNVDYIKIGSNIREIRKRMNYSLEKLADKLDMSLLLLNRIERGMSKVSLDSLVKISNILQIPIEELLADVDKKEYNKTIFYLKNNNYKYARGVISDNGFTILKGSEIKPGKYDSLSAELLSFFERERASEDIVNGKFIRDHECSSSSMAAVLILGRNSNGRKEWKTEDGTNLEDVLKNGE